jgi:hypothetical protein
MLCAKDVGMTIHKYSGGCHCGNITFEMEVAGKPASYNPRACDCDFCLKHAASYVSDPGGKLIIMVENEANLSRYRQGSGIADFLVCKICGALVGVCHGEHERLYAAINSKTVENAADFGPETAVSPKTLNDQDRVQRWKNSWFSNVSIKKISG